MTDVEKEVKALRRDVDKLISLAETMTERHGIMMKRFREHEDFSLRMFRKLKEYCHFLHDRLHAVFHKVFPDDLKYGDEFRRILGDDIGPEEPRKRP